MAAIKSEMPPLHAAESTASALSAIGSGGVSSGSGSGGGANGPTGNASSATANSSTSSASGANAATVNNTISAAADSSDNQPGTPQPQTQQIGVNEQHQQQQQQSQQTATSTGGAHNPYAPHNMYGATNTTAAGSLPHMYSGSIYATSSGNGAATGHDMQQQQQQHQQHSSYPSYLSSYEQFYQQQGQAQSSHNNGSGNGPSSLDFGSAASLYSSNNSNDFKSSAASGIRYHPYLQTPTSNGGGGGSLSNENGDVGAASVPSQVGLPLSSNNGAVSTTTAMSPRVVSSSSPTSTSTQLHMGGGGSNVGGGNPQSPACGQQLLCKKCGIMCTNETELQEHITNVHGASPYGSSGYSSSPYIKEELTGAPTNQPQQQQQQAGANPNELLDLDSQKMIYPPLPGSMQSIMGHSGLHHQQHHAMHDPIVNDPLHSMHSMQQRALPGWDQPANMGGSTGNSSQEGLPPYLQQADITQKPNQSPYYSPKQSPYHGASVPGVTNIKHEYAIIKSEYADSQNYVDKSFDPTVAAATDMCQQTPNASGQQSMLPVSSSPAEFPSTTTGPAQEQQAPYRNFEPPTSSSVLPANSITAKAATWKSNEARRPKTYNCTACNKWFTSSGHLKRHYNTTLHKNAVKTSGQPDPATMPISAHHHPARDPNGKASRRGNNNSSAAAAAAAAAQQQKPPAPVQPPEPPRTPPDFGSTTQQQASVANGAMPFGQVNGYQQQPQPYLSQVQSTTNVSPQHGSSAVGATQSPIQTETVLNGHPNGLAGPSALIPTTAALPTLLMPSSHTRGLLNTTTTTTIIKRETSAEEDINNTTTTTNTTMLRSPMDMSMMGDKEATEMLPAVLDGAAETEAAAAAAQTQLQTHHQMLVKEELPELEVEDYQLLDLQQRHYPSSTHSSNQIQSPLIICQQQYQEQLHLQQQQMVADIFSQQQQQPPAHMLPLPPPSTMEAYSILGISTPQPHNSNMQLLPPSQRITSTTATTPNMDSIHMLPLPPPHSLLRHQQPEEPEQPAHNMLNSTTITSMPDTHRSTIITPHMPLPSIIPSYQQVPQPEAPLPLEHTMTYHTIIGNSNYGNNITALSTSTGTGTSSSDESGNNSDQLQLSAFDPYGTASMFTTTTDGQLLQIIPNSGLMQQTYFSTFPTRTAAVAESYVRSYSSSSTQRSPQEADLPPISSLKHAYNQTAQEPQQTMMTPHDMPYSPTVSSSTSAENSALLDDYKSAITSMEEPLPNRSTPKSVAKQNSRKLKRSNSGTTTTTTNNENPAKRKRNSTGENAAAGVSTTTANMMLPSGRIKCLECNKEFTKVCYLTQHNKCFHSGEYPFRCEKCGKRFQDEQVYTTHLARHKTVDKPHKCDLCPKQFHHKTDLRRHVEGIHTGMKQHVCDICEKSFCRKDHLRKHLETHNRPRVVSRKNANRAAKNAQPQTIIAQIEIVVKNEDFTDPSPSMPRLNEGDGGGDSSSSPLDGNCDPLDLYVVIKNEHEKQLDTPQFASSMNTQELQKDDLAEDDLELDADDEDNNTFDDEYLLGGCDRDDEITHHKLLMRHASLPHFQQPKLLQPL